MNTDSSPEKATSSMFLETEKSSIPKTSFPSDSPNTDGRPSIIV